jgi:hypothetical protein
MAVARPKWRDTKYKDTAVIVYSIAQESVHLLVHNIPIFIKIDDIESLLNPFGTIIALSFYSKDEENFSHSYHVQYASIETSRNAKKRLDDKSFYGAHLHVVYATQFETLNQTKDKIMLRKSKVLESLQDHKKPTLVKVNDPTPEFLASIKNPEPSKFTSPAEFIFEQDNAATVDAIRQKLKRVKLLFTLSQQNKNTNQKLQTAAPILTKNKKTKFN